MLGAIFNKIPLEGFYSVRACREAVTSYFSQYGQKYRPYGFIPLLPTRGESEGTDGDHSAMRVQEDSLPSHLPPTAPIHLCAFAFASIAPPFSGPALVTTTATDTDLNRVAIPPVHRATTSSSPSEVVLVDAFFKHVDFGLLLYDVYKYHVSRSTSSLFSLLSELTLLVPPTLPSLSLATASSSLAFTSSLSNNVIITWSKSLPLRCYSKLFHLLLNSTHPFYLIIFNSDLYYPIFQQTTSNSVRLMNLNRNHPNKDSNLIKHSHLTKSTTDMLRELSSNRKDATSQGTFNEWSTKGNLSSNSLRSTDDIATPSGQFKYQRGNDGSKVPRPRESPPTSLLRMCAASIVSGEAVTGMQSRGAPQRSREDIEALAYSQGAKKGG